jgi:anthranilate synthase component I
MEDARSELTLNLEETEAAAIAGRYPRPLYLPLFCEAPLPANEPGALYEHLRQQRGFLLESLEGSEKVARYSFLCTAPHAGIDIGADGTVTISGDARFCEIAGSPKGSNAIEIVRSIMDRFTVVPAPLPRFSGGLVGYFAYDLVYALHPTLPSHARDDLRMPVARFMLARNCVVLDHLEKRLFIIANLLVTDETDVAAAYREGKAAISALKDQIDGAGPVSLREAPRSFGESPAVSSSLSREEYQSAVRCLKEQIYAGEIFQAVLSRRLACPLAGDPFRVYRRLRAENPSPYMYYLDFGDCAVVGSSPEMLVRVADGQVMTVPIAGTRPRGATPEEDASLAAELLGDEKERAEHIMLVDLARNDIGAVCAYGSVTLDEFMGVERFSHVQHIVSTVSGRLREGSDCFDVLSSCFPAGTVSGAPKVRAMQLVDEIEGTRRGPYAGAVGYIGFTGTMDMAITIRTIVVRDGTAYIQVGAGIVADSDPEREWIETENKGRAMVQALSAGVQR